MKRSIAVAVVLCAAGLSLRAVAQFMPGPAIWAPGGAARPAVCAFGYPVRPFQQHGAGLATVQTYVCPGAVQAAPTAAVPTVLGLANAYPNASFPQHSTGMTTSVQSKTYSGAVQPH